MNSLFVDLCTGLQKSIDFEKGICVAKKATYVISPVKEFNSENIREFRKNIDLSDIPEITDFSESHLRNART